MQICSSHFYGTIFIYLTKICWIFSQSQNQKGNKKANAEIKTAFKEGFEKLEVKFLLK